MANKKKRWQAMQKRWWVKLHPKWWSFVCLFGWFWRHLEFNWFAIINVDSNRVCFWWLICDENWFRNRFMFKFLSISQKLIYLIYEMKNLVRFDCFTWLPNFKYCNRRFSSKIHRTIKSRQHSNRLFSITSISISDLRL